MRIALAVALVLLLAPAAWCQVGGAESLLIQPSARSAGMGDCTMAVTDDASASSWNPGGLVFMQGDINGTGVFSELSPDWGGVHYWYGAAGVRVADKAVIAASVTHVSYGQQNVMDDEGNPGLTFECYEVTPSGAVAMAIGEYVGVGMNLKYVKIVLPPASMTAEGVGGEGTALAVDIGVEGRAGLDMGDLDILFRAAGAIQHLGPDIEYTRGWRTDPLAKNMKLGASGQLSYGKAGHALVCGQYDKSLVGGFDNDSSGIWGLGGELQFSLLGLISEVGGRGGSAVRDLLTGRIGYVNDEDADIEGMSYGFGVGVEMNDIVLLSLDIARVPLDEDLTEPWRVGGSGWFAF